MNGRDGRDGCTMPVLDRDVLPSSIPLPIIALHKLSGLVTKYSQHL